MLNPDGTKTCALCRNALPTEQFYKVKRPTGDGFHAYCKPCVKIKAVLWQKANPDRMLVRWRKESKERAQARIEGRVTPAQKRSQYEAQKRWNDSNRDRKALLTKQSKLRQKEANLSLYRAKTAIHNNKTRCRRLHQGSDFTIEDWGRVMCAFENKCAFCGCSPQFLDLDHLTPIKLGGPNCVGNIIPICRPCNGHKTSTDPYAFAKLMGKDFWKLRERATVRHSYALGWSLYADAI